MFLPVTSSQVFTNPSWSFLIFLHSRKRTCPAKDEHILGMKESTTTHVVDPVEMKRMTCQTQGEDTCSQTVQQVKVLNLFKSLSASLLFMTVPQTFSVNVSKSQQKLLDLLLCWLMPVCRDEGPSSCCCLWPGRTRGETQSPWVSSLLPGVWGEHSSTS